MTVENMKGSEMKQYEYKVETWQQDPVHTVEAQQERFQAWLNERGAKGWHLASSNIGFSQRWVECVFARLLPPKEAT